MSLELEWIFCGFELLIMQDLIVTYAERVKTSRMLFYSKPRRQYQTKALHFL